MATTDDSLAVRAKPPATLDDARDGLEHAVRALFGALAVAAEVLAQALADSTARPDAEAGRPVVLATESVNTVLGVGWWAARTTHVVVGRVRRRAQPVIRVALDPPLVPARFTPRQVLARQTETWMRERPDAVRSFTTLSEGATLTVAGLVGNLLQADSLAMRALRLVDLEAIAESVLEKLDVDRLAHQALGGIDTTRLVLDEVDIVTLAQAAIDGVDLPRIVRESSTSMASETVDSIRLQGIDADRAVTRIVDRLLRRADKEST